MMANISPALMGSKQGKSAEQSALFRKQGNDAFGCQDFQEAARKYGRSIATAPCHGDTTDLALAFANRSAVQVSLGNYEECLSDITQALKADYPSRLRHKLLRRRAECHRAMGDMAEATLSLQEAIACCSEQDKKLNMEQELLALKPPKKRYEPRLRLRPPPELYLGENAMIPGASSCVAIKRDEKYGRHLVATQDIPPGVTVLVEKPFASQLRPDKFEYYCLHCMRPCSAMIPCKSCTLAMYCSESCREASWSRSHEFECPILELLMPASTVLEDGIYLTLSMFAVALKKHKNLSELHDKVTRLHCAESPVDMRIDVCDAEGRFDPTHLRAVNYLSQLRRAYKGGLYNGLHENIATLLVKVIDAKTELFRGQSKEVRKFVHKLLVRYVRIREVNSFGVANISPVINDDVGSAIFPLASLVNHRCVPNTFRYEIGDTIVFVSALPIAKGEQLFVSYYNELTMPRQGQPMLDISEIETTHGFKCGCRGCTNPLRPGTFLPLCPGCRTIVRLEPEQVTVTCPGCNETVNGRKIMREAMTVLNRIKHIDDNVAFDEANTPEICELIAKIYKMVALAPNLEYSIHKLLMKQNHVYVIGN